MVVIVNSLTMTTTTTRNVVDRQTTYYNGNFYIYGEEAGFFLVGNGDINLLVIHTHTFKHRITIIAFYIAKKTIKSVFLLSNIWKKFACCMVIGYIK